ncbi:SPFH/Band 7/PHB domain protein [Flaviflexus ciconiae]|uniref:SPFH/Band 7/PHB domain protein n=1 Tax=Flaviflexus ciconiae TaxID=2496867 RepID=A0A3S9PVS8_9ACTO|nr:SPFH domain-containing protein [Flaviflexus ciconiae]AZQ76402.1 SPFH/Band 7/PHB domain protein [Flaviflexus ciconiae]
MPENFEPGQIILWILLLVIILFIGAALFKAVRIVSQGEAQIVERLGKYHRTLTPGMHFLVPFIDQIRQRVDLREQVVPFPPQPVITSDNIVVNIDTVIYYQVTGPEAATYEIANPMAGIEQLAVTTLRNIIGSMDMEQALTGRDQINGQLRGVLDEATGRWGIRVNRVELKAIDPPATVQSAMEQQMKAERDRRAAILTAEGIKQSAILTAEGEKQSAILRAEGDAQSTILRAQGESRAILQVFDAIHRGNADPKLLAYEYIQMLPKIADSESSKMWIIPTELTEALNSVTQGFGGKPNGPTVDTDDNGYQPKVDFGEDEDDVADALRNTALPDIDDALAAAKGEAARATDEASEAGETSGRRARRDDLKGQDPDRPHPDENK